MSEHSPQTYSTRMAEIEAAKAAFFAQGGRVNESAAADYVPRPPAIPGEASERKKQREAEEARKKASFDARQAVIDNIRKLAETMTYSEAMIASGYSQQSLRRIAHQGGFAFQPDPRLGRGERNYIDPEVDAKMCERLKALRDVGLSRHAAARRMEISGSFMTRLLTMYKIPFPSRKPRRCAA
jgi:hypothetical protein